MARQGRWWEEPKTKRHESVVATAQRIDTESTGQVQRFANYIRYYSGIRADQVLSMGVLGLVNANAAPGRKGARLTYNLIKRIIDWKQSKVANVDIRPFAITSGGSWDKKQRAKKLTRFIDGMFYEAATRTLMPLKYRWSRVIGTGVVKVYEDVARKRPAIELTFPLELRIDARDGAMGKPRQIIQVRQVHRDVLRECYPSPVSGPTAISNAKLSKGTTTTVAAVADLVDVFEAWHLPSGPNARDGVHVICTDAGTLFEEPWTDDDFPFVFLRPDKRLIGFWGVGDAEDLEAYQDQLNEHLRVKQTALRLCAIPGYGVRRGSNVVLAHMSTDIGRIVQFDAEPPVPLQTPQIPADLQQSIDEIIQQAHQEKHVNLMASNGALPAGLSGSGESQRVFADTQTELFGIEGKEYEQAHIEVARKLIKVARRIHERDGSFAVTVPGRKFLESIKWAEVDLADDEFDLQILPTSNLPKTLSGRLASVQELMQAGMIDPQHGRRLLDFPDLEEDTNLSTALIDHALWCISRILDHGDYPPVEPYMQLDLCLDLGRRALLRAEMDEAPERTLETLRKWIAEVGAKLQGPADNAPPGPAAMPPGPGAMPPGPAAGGPMGQPAAPPVSNLLPVNGQAA